MAAPLGTGQRFQALEHSFGSNVRNPAALAASIGRKKYGATRFAKLSAHGRGDMGSAGNVLKARSLTDLVGQMVARGSFKKSNTSVPARAGWRGVGGSYTQPTVTGQRSTAGVGTRTAAAITGHRDHLATRGSQAPKKNAVVGD